jgi:hypothetical protein
LATPPFMAGPSGVDQQTPSVPTGAPQQGQPGQDQVQQLIAKILSSQQSGQHLARPVPAPVPPGGNSQTLVGKHTGFANLGNAIGSTIQTAIHNQKQSKLAHAESQWNQMTTLMQDQSPQGKQKLDAWMMANQKDLKNMAKALNQDWLNPEKTDVWKQGLGSTLKQHQNKQQAMQGIMSTFKTLIGKANAPRPDLSADQSKQMNQEILSKAPTAQGGLSPDAEKFLMETMKEDAKSKADDKKAAADDKRQQEKEQFEKYKIDTSQKFQMWRENTHQQFQTNLERIRQNASDNREASREGAMLKAQGIRLSADDAKRFTVTPAQLNTQVNGSLSSMKSQLAQANQQLTKIKDQASKSRWYHPWSEAGNDEVAEAQKSYDNLKNSVNYIESNRAAIVSGKKELEDVVNDAEQIATGSPDLSDLGGKAQ